MKNKNVIVLLFLLVVPLSFALEEINFNLGSTQNVVTIGYDNLNRIVQKNSSSEIINYSYDKQLQGTLNNISFGNSSYKYTYDDKLRVIEEKRIIDGIGFTKTYIYDSNDRLVSEMFNGQDLDYYYNTQNKINQIRGYINQTKYNPAGNPLNRTYFNNKITTFDYIPTNLRLNQIKTNTIQQINYTYDNVGNIIRINDSVNNRTYVMTYDNLDRLTNYTVNGYSYIYSIDGIGRILKVIKNNTKTTSLKYNNGVAHFPSKSITQDTGVDIYRTSVYNLTNRTQLVQFYLVNEKNTSISRVNYTVEFGNNKKFNSTNLSLAKGAYVLVTVEHNYSAGGNYKVNITGRANTTATDIETINLIFGTIVNDFNVLLKNATRLILELDAQNTITDLSQNWKWNCSNIVNSTVPFNTSSSENLMVIIEHNFTLNNNGYNITCRLNSSDGNQSKTLNFNFDGIKVEGYNSTLTDSDTVLVKFQIKNYYSTLNNINWNITSNGLKYNASGITLTQGQTTSVTQELNFTNAGLKQIKITIGSGNFTDTYSENIRLYSLGIQQYINFIKNGTTRIFNFIIRNDWNALTTYWNFTNPALTHAVNLSQNESLIVVIVENYAQGQKDTAVNAFNSSQFEDFELDNFRIKHVGINKLESLFDNTTKSIIDAFVVNNVQKLNVSWQLNSTEQLINSTKNLELSTSEQGIIVIESNFSSSGIYPLNLRINSSTMNDNTTGVAVT